jgi:hypothetical protein
MSNLELYQYIGAAEEKTRGQRALVRNSILPGFKMRKRSETPSERIASDDEAAYAEQEQRVVKRMADHDRSTMMYEVETVC